MKEHKYARKNWSTDPDFPRHGFSFFKHARASRHVFLGSVCYWAWGAAKAPPMGSPSRQELWRPLWSQMTSPAIANPACTVQVCHFTHFLRSRLIIFPPKIFCGQGTRSSGTPVHWTAWTRLQCSDRYGGARPFRHWRTVTASLKRTRSGTSSQCSWSCSIWPGPRLPARLLPSSNS